MIDISDEIQEAVKIEDFENAIALLKNKIHVEPNHETALVMLGLICYQTKKYLEAIEVFEKAIKLGHKTHRVFLEYASSLAFLNRNNEAIIFYTEAFKIESPFKLETLFQRGFTYVKCCNTKAALNDFLAIKKNIEQNNIEFERISLLDFFIGETYASKLDYNNAINFLKRSEENKFSVFLANKVPELNTNDDDKKFIFFTAYQLYQLTELTRINVVNSAKNTDIAFCHYTSLEVVDKLIFKNDEGNDNTMRYYNAIHMADPEEGNTIFELLGESAKFLFEKGKDNQGSNVYLGSFMESKDCDKHIMWRTYGKGKGEEARGCSLVIKNEFFDGKFGSFNNYTIDTNKNRVGINNCLNKVYYYNSEEKTIVNDENSDVKNNLQNVALLIERLHQLYSSTSISEVKKSIELIVNRAISEIQYLFKSSDWDYEKEYRIIQVIPHNNPEVLVDKFSSPKKLYINSPKIVKEHLQKIILGAKVKNPAEWISLDAQLKKENKEVEFSFSKCKFQ
jgi:tetratricopeptide (TPR) repeat protein